MGDRHSLGSGAAMIERKLSEARRMRCRGCGRELLFFMNRQEIVHAEPECKWFLENMATEAQFTRSIEVARIHDDVSNLKTRGKG